MDKLQDDVMLTAFLAFLVKTGETHPVCLVPFTVERSQRAKRLLPGVNLARSSKKPE